MRYAGSAFIVVTAASLVLAGCGSEADEDTTPTTTLNGHVTYEGTATGAVTFAFFSTETPLGPPDGGSHRFEMNQVAFDGTTHQFAYEFTHQKQGTWTAYLGWDIGGNNPTFPGSEDYYVLHTQKVVIDETPKTITLDWVIPATKP
jgi:hypothetical protein